MNFCQNGNTRINILHIITTIPYFFWEWKWINWNLISGMWEVLKVMCTYCWQVSIKAVSTPTEIPWWRSKRASIGRESLENKHDIYICINFKMLLMIEEKMSLYTNIIIIYITTVHKSSFLTRISHLRDKTNMPSGITSALCAVEIYSVLEKYLPNASFQHFSDTVIEFDAFINYK